MQLFDCIKYKNTKGVIKYGQIFKIEDFLNLSLSSDEDTETSKTYRFHLYVLDFVSASSSEDQDRFKKLPRLSFTNIIEIINVTQIINNILVLSLNVFENAFLAFIPGMQDIFSIVDVPAKESIYFEFKLLKNFKFQKSVIGWYLFRMEFLALVRRTLLQKSQIISDRKLGISQDNWEQLKNTLIANGAVQKISTKNQNVNFLYYLSIFPNLLF